MGAKKIATIMLKALAFGAFTAANNIGSKKGRYGFND